MSTLLLALKLLGLSNAWNVAGWVILGAVAAILLRLPPEIEAHGTPF